MCGWWPPFPMCGENWGQQPLPRSPMSEMGISISWGDLLFNACPLVDGNASDGFCAATIAIISLIGQWFDFLHKENSRKTATALFTTPKLCPTDRYRFLSTTPDMPTCLLAGKTLHHKFLKSRPRTSVGQNSRLPTNTG